jgi:hypothetical protein
MMRLMRRTATLTAAALLLASAAGGSAQPQPPASEDIGSWNLSCTQDRMTDRSRCILRLRDWVDRPGDSTPGLALEIQNRGGRLVPVVTARELTLEGASRGLLALTGAAQLRFPPNPYFEMPCGLEGRTLSCAPRQADADRAERELPTADRVLVRMVGLGAGSSDTEPVELRLADTARAMERYRRFAPPGTAPAETSGISGRDALEQLRQLFGR